MNVLSSALRLDAAARSWADSQPGFFSRRSIERCLVVRDLISDSRKQDAWPQQKQRWKRGKHAGLSTAGLLAYRLFHPPRNGMWEIVPRRVSGLSGCSDPHLHFHPSLANLSYFCSRHVEASWSFGRDRFRADGVSVLAANMIPRSSPCRCPGATFFCPQI